MNSQENGVQSILNNILSKHSSSSNWNRVCINTSETFLIDRMLTNRWWDLFFSWVSDKMILKNLINNKNWFQMMNVFSLLNMCSQVYFWANSSLRNFWELCLNIETKCSKLLDINWSSSSNIFSEIFNECFPNNNHLSFWLKRLQIWTSPLSGLIMFSWVLMTILQNPIIKLYVI